VGRQKRKKAGDTNQKAVVANTKGPRPLIHAAPGVALHPEIREHYLKHVATRKSTKKRTCRGSESEPGAWGTGRRVSGRSRAPLVAAHYVFSWCQGKGVRGRLRPVRPPGRGALWAGEPTQHTQAMGGWNDSTCARRERGRPSETTPSDHRRKRNRKRLQGGHLEQASCPPNLVATTYAAPS